MLLNVLRMRAYRNGVIPQHIPTMAQMSEPSFIDSVSFTKEFKKDELPEYLTLHPSKLSKEDKLLIRNEFYSYCNMNSIHLYKWIKDPRVLDGSGTRRIDRLRTRKRLLVLLTLKTGGHRNGSNWGHLHYSVAQECVFVFHNLFQPKRTDYVNWALLRNFGLDWVRPTKLYPRRALPAKVKTLAERALRRYQISGKPRRRKQV
jgi:hypothetical protein